MEENCKSCTEQRDSLSTQEALRVARTQLLRLSTQHLSIQENERRRIATELHDGLGQVLSLVKLTTQDVTRSLNSGATNKAGSALERLSSQVKSALDEMRRIAMNLRPSTLDDLGIVATLSWYYREFQAACQTTKLECDIGISESDVPEPLKISIFRIVQEATSNALKHAKAERIKVALTSTNGRIELVIEDNGVGFDQSTAAEHRDFSHGIGLQSMQERAELSGGNYEFRSAPGKGTRIGVSWQVVPASDPDCPVIPLKEAQARSICRSVPDSKLEDEFMDCLACVRRLGAAPMEANP